MSKRQGNPGDHKPIPGPFTIDEMINQQMAYELAKKAGLSRYEHLNWDHPDGTGWTLDDLLEMKASFELLDDD